MDTDTHPHPSVVDGDTLRRLRGAGRGWSQRELARAAGINSSIVSRLERGLQASVDATVLVALAHALGVTVDDLLVSRDRQQGAGSLDAELISEVAHLADLSVARQRHAAALLRANRLAFPDRQDTPDDHPDP